MNKAALKSFAVSARQDLIHKVSLRAQLFGIDAENNLKSERQGEKLMVNKLAYPFTMEGTFDALKDQYSAERLTGCHLLSFCEGSRWSSRQY